MWTQKRNMELIYNPDEVSDLSTSEIIIYVHEYNVPQFNENSYKPF